MSLADPAQLLQAGIVGHDQFDAEHANVASSPLSIWLTVDAETLQPQSSSEMALRLRVDFAHGLVFGMESNHRSVISLHSNSSSSAK